MEKARSSWKKRIRTAIKWIGIVLLTLIVLVSLIVVAIRTYRAAQAKITSPNGIQESGFVTLNGIRQFLQIRGEDQTNPVIVVLHGGPGSPITFLSSYYQRALEQDYTIVNFDQRGSGRTYYENREAGAALSAQAILADTDAIIDYARERFGQEKVIVLGHSWGTVLGSTYVKEHPEKVEAYIGVGQCVNNMEGDAFAAEEGIRRARNSGDEETAQEISALLRRHINTQDTPEKFLLTMDIRHAGAAYFHYAGEMSMLQTIWLGLTSPDMSLTDMRWFLTLGSSMESFLRLQQPLLADCIGFDANRLGVYEVPVYYISGEQDWITPAVLVEEYYQTVEAPEKQMRLIPDAGHTPFLDAPEAFSDAVLELMKK